ncbi:hypothetical protein M0657_004542 [Pyricularia oryzae]|nr:hypothetical protein M0657_004542 [Pyricularia oryzae]KAI7925226.1 hypothetical protein M9X92_003405 [Pyricularia oryzae]
MIPNRVQTRTTSLSAKTFAVTYQVNLTSQQPVIPNTQSTHNMSGQPAMPVPISPGRSSLQIVTPKDLYASLTENISSKPPSFLALREHDFIVPAPPPPSPISFRVHPDQRPKPPRS